MSQSFKLFFRVKNFFTHVTQLINKFLKAKQIPKFHLSMPKNTNKDMNWKFVVCWLGSSSWTSCLQPLGSPNCRVSKRWATPAQPHPPFPTLATYGSSAISQTNPPNLHCLLSSPWTPSHLSHPFALFQLCYSRCFLSSDSGPLVDAWIFLWQWHLSSCLNVSPTSKKTQSLFSMPHFIAKQM